MKPNPYLVVLGIVAIFAFVFGVGFSSTAVGLGIGLITLGGLAAIAWLSVSAVTWTKDR